VVAAVNEAGRAESSPTGFEITIPEAPVLTWLSAARDPTCLTVEWTSAGIPVRVAAVQKVILTGTTENASFDASVGRTDTEAEFCAADYPIVDEMTYTAQVVTEFDGPDLASNTREFTVDFDPEYSLTGVWHGAYVGFGQVALTLTLVDTDGDISGFVTWNSFETWEVTGTRLGGDVELIFDSPDYDHGLSGYFEGPDRITGIIGYIAGPIWARVERD
jgi:hypothetical protein